MYSIERLEKRLCIWTNQVNLKNSITVRACAHLLFYIEFYGMGQDFFRRSGSPAATCASKAAASYPSWKTYLSHTLWWQVLCYTRCLHTQWWVVEQRTSQLPGRNCVSLAWLQVFAWKRESMWLCLPRSCLISCKNRRLWFLYRSSMNTIRVFTSFSLN